MPEQGGDILAHFGQDQFLERYQRYKAHINEWRQQYPKLTAVDLRYDQQVVLEMATGTNVAQAAADEQAGASAGAEQGEPMAANPAEVPASQTGTKPVLAANAAAGKPAAKAGVLKATGKAGAKPVGGGSAKAKDKAATAKSAKVKAKEKKRAEAKRAALNLSRRKTAPTGRPATSAGMGQ
jgi:cell division protein FtsQ